jgi:hypothetical protein
LLGRAIKQRFLTNIVKWSLIVACYAKAMQFPDTYAFQDSEIELVLKQVGELLQKCKNIAKSMKIGRPSRYFSSIDLNFAPPRRDVADAAGTNYTLSFESTYRILHVPSFVAQYEAFWSNPNIEVSLQLTLLLVIAIGSNSCSGKDVVDSFCNKTHQWVYAAEMWLSGPLEKDRLDVGGLQIHCLVILARQNLSIGGDLVWASLGSLIHKAMQIGLHHDPKHLPPMSLLQAEIRRRLWTTIVEMVVQSSLDSSMPPRISLDDFDTNPPSNLSDEEVEESTTVLCPHPEDVFTSTSLQLILLKSLGTRLQILKLLNGLSKQASYTKALALDFELINSIKAYTKFLNLNDPFTSNFQWNMLDCLVRRFVLYLNFPFANQSKTNQLFHYPLKMSLESAIVLLSPKPDQEFFRLRAIGGGMFKEDFRNAYSAISFELLTQIEAQRLDGTLFRNQGHRDMLKTSPKGMVSFSLERIRLGETNVKSHMFLSMILAQVESMELDTAPELSVAQSAKRSLECCYDLLKTKMDVDSYSNPNSIDMTVTGFDDMQSWDQELDFFLAETEFSPHYLFT